MTHEEIKAAWAATLKHLEGGDRLAREVDAELNPGWPPEFAKPRFVVPDNQAEAFRKAFGDAADIIPLSETYLPIG